MTKNLSAGDAQQVHLSLTGTDSHLLRREPGVGSCTIGQGHDADLVVAAHDRIDWRAFEDLQVPAGGHWPRWFHYSGDDAGFFGWSVTRPIEGFYWTPRSAQEVDAAAANIRDLQITVPEASLRIELPTTQLHNLELSGRLDKAAFSGQIPAKLSLSIETKADRATAPADIPIVPGLTGVTSLSISATALRQPVSLRMLGGYPDIEQLELSGSFTDLEMLTEFPKLQSIALRFLPDLSGMPPLTSWPELDSFLAWNIESEAGKSLRSQLRKLQRERELGQYSGVRQLRTSAWFEQEYGLPYAAWPPTLAKQALKAHRKALKMLAEATDSSAAEQAISDFVTSFNRFSTIETSEREDLGVAVAQLAAAAPELITASQAQDVFDRVRNF